MLSPRCRNPISLIFAEPGFRTLSRSVQSMNKWLNRHANHNYLIISTLATEFSLVLGNKDKPTCSVTDLFNLLKYKVRLTPPPPMANANYHLLRTGHAFLFCIAMSREGVCSCMKWALHFLKDKRNEMNPSVPATAPYLQLHRLI